MQHLTDVSPCTLFVFSIDSLPFPCEIALLNFQGIPEDHNTVQ
jgi:hypothetical protein